MTTPVPSLGQLSPGPTRAAIGRAIAGTREDQFLWRLGVVGAATDSKTYVVQLSGDATDRVASSISDQVPAVGNAVRVMQVGPSYIITDVVGNRGRQSGTQLVNITGAISGSAAVVFPVPFTGVPHLSLTVQTAASLFAVTNTPTAAGFTATVFQSAGLTVTTTCTVHWLAFGV